MGLNTNFNPRTMDYGSSRAQMQKLIAKAKAKLAAEGSDPALEQLKRTMESLPKPAEWTMKTGRWDWGNIFSEAQIVLPSAGIYDAGTITIDPAPKPWRPEFRQQRAQRDWLLPAASEYMRQEELAFPPVPESDLFRVEHAFDRSFGDKLGVGPYQRSYQLDEVPYSEQCPDTGEDLTPGPYSDVQLREALLVVGGLSSRHFFGFGSLDAMKSWFRSPRFWESCRRADFVVRRYHGVVFHGRRQSVIDSKFPVARLETVEV